MSVKVFIAKCTKAYCSHRCQRSWRGLGTAPHGAGPLARGVCATRAADAPKLAAAATTPVARKVRRSIIGDFRLCTSFDLSFSNGEESPTKPKAVVQRAACGLAPGRMALESVRSKPQPFAA
ncbi:hypothetical protein XFF6166_260016 [Xanthomonas citri pv. fuscans]|nr:hypothetical protein XFF6166_260016 [Xanthomonas citri pv. fuscans]SOO08759.1 hypothetical protein XFF6970_280016 [Xanthomonas citri pv. fuscans]SOO14924.1 hypothetical protein XFF7766_440004 [Xanthomonas citri pv. fuscans]